MNTLHYITELDIYLKNLIPSGELDLHGKKTIDYDKLLSKIYEFAMDTVRKDKEPAGDRAEAFKIACEKLIRKIQQENQ